MKLWQRVRDAMVAIWPNDRAVFTNAEVLVADLHRIDPSGQNLRYSRDRNDVLTVSKYPTSVDLAQLQTDFGNLVKVLDACADELGERAANAREGE